MMNTPATTNGGMIFCFGANHRSADIALREKLFAGEDQILARLPVIKEQFGFAELATLSTCNRFEIFGVTQADAPCVDDTFHDAFVAFDLLQHDTATRLRGASYALTGRDAVRHLFSVASSLDSLVVGETQITGQFKQALAIAEQARTIGPVLKRLGQDALATSKKVRTRTAIGRGRVSIGHASVELVKKIFNDPASRNFVIIGAGEMAEVTARCVLQYNPRSLTIVNRGLDRARDLRARILDSEPGKMVHIASLDQIDRVLDTADIVISATGSTGTIISRDHLASVLRGRKRRPLLMVDIALPRDIDPACGTLDEVFLFDIDDLRQVVDANRRDREAAAGEASLIIEESVTAYERWLAHMTVAPALSHFNSHIDQLFRREAARTLTRAGVNAFDEHQQALILQLLDVLASRLTADAGRGLKDLVNEGRGHDAAQLLTRLFTKHIPGDSRT